MMDHTVQQWMHSMEIPQPFPERGDIVFGLVRFDAEAQMFRIYMGLGYDSTCAFSSDEVLSPSGFLDLLFRIHSTDWITGQHFKDLLDCVTCWAYREHGRFPAEFFGVMGAMDRGLDAP